MKLGSIISYFKLAMGIIYNTKWRNFWTILGIIIGLSSVVTIISIGEGIKYQINSQLVSTSNNYLVVEPRVLNQLNGSSNSLVSSFDNLSLVGNLSYIDLTTTQETKGIDLVAPFSLIKTKVNTTNFNNMTISVVGTNNFLPDFLNLNISSGQFIDQPNQPSNSVVIGQSLAVKLFHELSPLGATIYLSNQPYVVQGILNRIGNLPLGQTIDYNNAALIDYNNAQTLSSGNVFLYQIFAKLNAGQNNNKIKNLLQSNLDKSNGNQTNTTVSNISDISSSSKKILDLITRLIAMVASISLLVAGIGIMNVMFVSVAERTHEIGIRKAIGATNRQIISQFLIEATILSFIGGLLGVILSYVIDLFILIATSIKPIISFQLILISLVVSILIGIIFGSIPAIKAAKKIPIDALRSS